VFKRKLSKILNPAAAEILAQFRFDLKENDILFLYGRDAYSIVAIGKVRREYYFSLDKMKYEFKGKLNFPYFVDVEWFCNMRNIPLGARRILENSRINLQPTLVQIKNPEIYNEILKIARRKKSDIDFSDYILNLKGVSEAEIKEAEKEIEDISQKPFSMLANGRGLVVSKRKARDTAFARKIVTNYDGKCVICGSRWIVDSSLEVEAAHIIPVEHDGLDDIRNGFALCRFHHWSFDKGVFSVDDDYKVVVSPRVKEFSESYETIGRLKGNSINLPKDGKFLPNKDALKFHRDKIFVSQ